MVMESAAFTGIQELDLVFSPVNDSMHTQVYVCRVTRDGGNGRRVTAVQNFTVNVDGKTMMVSVRIINIFSVPLPLWQISHFSFLSVPPDAITATVSSSGTATAGMVYSLTCTVSKTVDGLTNSPTAMWTTGGMAVTNVNGITVSDTIGDTIVTNSTLTFDPLRTSHNGSFVCCGILISSALDGVLKPSAREELEIKSKATSIIMYINQVYNIYPATRAHTAQQG
jgi:hypothetical protein